MCSRWTAPPGIETVGRTLGIHNVIGSEANSFTTSGCKGVRHVACVNCMLAFMLLKWTRIGRVKVTVTVAVAVTVQ
jgi:hypothetical protein